MVLLMSSRFAAGTSAEQDLYKLLGVSRTATAKEIKQAYRRKARETHPDKRNTNVSAEEAAEAFRKVVQAFEVLSDDTSRQRYDRTGRTDSNSFGGQQQRHQQNQGFQWTWNVRFQTRRKLKDQFEVQQAQSRVLHVVSLTQLQTIMLDDDDLLERNLLLCFTTKATETHADDEMVFPYPFAGMSSQGIWWEDLLQTVRIKFHRSSELSRFFGVTDQECNQSPVFLFAKRGTALTQELARALPRIQTTNRHAFEDWVWEQIQVNVEFVNRHDHPVEIYWVHGRKAHKKMEVAPGETGHQLSMLSHEWYVRDVRVDTRPDSPGRYKLSNESSLGSWKILSDEDPQQFIIEGGQCFDLSGHCQFWQMQDRSCVTNPIFMSEQCQKTCGLCASPKPVHDEF